MIIKASDYTLLYINDSSGMNLSIKPVKVSGEHIIW